MSSRDNREFLSTEQAHEKTGLSLRYLQQLLQEKRLEGFKTSSVWFVYADSLSAFLEQPRKRGPKGPRKKASQAHSSSSDVKKVDTAHMEGAMNDAGSREAKAGK